MKFIHITDIHLVSGDGLLNASVPSERLEKCLDDILKWRLDAEFRARARITTTSSTCHGNHGWVRRQQHR